MSFLKPQPKSGSRAKDPNSGNQRRLAKRTAENMAPSMFERRDKFIDALLRGETKYKAALAAGCQVRSAHKEASHMWNEPYVQERFMALREAIEENKLVTRKELILNAKSIAFDDEEQGSARVNASTHIAKMLGYDAPIKLESEVTHKGGVMMVPSSDPSIWEESAEHSQSKLKVTVRD